MKIIALGTSQFLVNCINGLIKSGCYFEEIISLPQNLLPDNSIDLKIFASEIGVNYFEIEDINSKSSKEHIKSLSPDLIFSSWPKIIDLEVLSIPKYGIIGTHPTALPFNKGRHPLQWQIVLGLQESKLTFFWMDGGIDSGSIILQAPYNIEPEDTILTLSDRVNSVALSSSYKLGKMLNPNDMPKGYQQESSSSTTWRKRDRFDVLIDFRMNSDDIIALIRSFGEPYPCAGFIYEDKYFNVIYGEKFEPEKIISEKYFEPGKVLKVEENYIYIKAAKHFLKLKCRQNLEKAVGPIKYVHPPTKYLTKYPKMAEIISH